MLGAGLIKIRGDPCWRDLTCMNYFYNTQPNPNPMAYFAHQAPAGWHAFETFGNYYFVMILEGSLSSLFTMEYYRLIILHKTASHTIYLSWHILGIFLFQGNHMIELVFPWCTFIPLRAARLFNGCWQVIFQIVLISTGNLR